MTRLCQDVNQAHAVGRLNLITEVIFGIQMEGLNCSADSLDHRAAKQMLWQLE